MNFLRPALATLLLTLVTCVEAAGLPPPRLAHTVWIGPGCERLVEMDELYEFVGGIIAQTGTRPRERMDRLELQCSGRLVKEARGLRAYLTTDVLITRQVPYAGGYGRLLLSRDSSTVELESRSLPGVQEQLRRALRQLMKGPLNDYARGRHPQIVPPARR